MAGSNKYTPTSPETNRPRRRAQGSVSNPQDGHRVAFRGRVSLQQLHGEGSENLSAFSWDFRPRGSGNSLVAPAGRTGVLPSESLIDPF